jgi:hypothetical protein
MGARTFLSGLLVSAWCTVCAADGPPVVWVPQPPPPGIPPTCDRFVPLPPHNAGCALFNLPSTGKDDPWRPPKVWPQTKYPVVPSYTRPSYGYYETSWRVLCVGGTAPAPVQSTLGIAPPPVPSVAQPTPASAVTPRPSTQQTAPPQAQPQVQPPQASPPQPGGPQQPGAQVPQTIVPPVTQPAPQIGPTQTGPPKATPPSSPFPLKPRRPENVAPAPGPQVNPPRADKRGANLFDVPTRTANETTNNDNFEMPDIAVKPF